MYCTFPIYKQIMLLTGQILIFGFIKNDNNFALVNIYCTHFKIKLEHFINTEINKKKIYILLMYWLITFRKGIKFFFCGKFAQLP